MATIPGNKDTYLCSDSPDDNGFLFHPYRSSLVYLPGNAPFLTGGRCFRCTCRTAPHVHVVPLHMHMSYCFTCTSKTSLPYDLRYVGL